MKFTFLFACFCILLFHSAFAQTYEKPYVESVGDRLCYITKVEFTKRNTIVSFEHLNNKGWIRLSDHIQIRTPENKSYHYIKSEGISIAPEMYHFKADEQKHAFTVYFEPLPKNTKIFDVIEVEPGSKFDFNFYGINLEKQRTTDLQIPHFQAREITDTVLVSPPPPPFSAGFTANSFKEIYQSSLQGLTDYFKQPEVLKEQAHLRKAFYDALLAEGFTSEQAMQILVSTPFK
nr:hypothetical protein [uncultured Pedobacter sp.]